MDVLVLAMLSVTFNISASLHSCRALRHTAQVQFSPDGRWIVSASFDKALKLWDGLKGTFVATFRGHVGPVYQVAWSSDSRLFVSGSKDSTLKVLACLLNSSGPPTAASELTQSMVWGVPFSRCEHTTGCWVAGEDLSC